MKSERPILVSRITRIVGGLLTQKQSTNIITTWWSSDFSIIDVGTTSSMTFVPLNTESIDMDRISSVKVNNMHIYAITNNDANAECKLQVSGDGGATPFIDMTDAIPGGYLTTQGPGLWISSIIAGAGGLKFRILGRSTDGNPATIRMARDSQYKITTKKSR